MLFVTVLRAVDQLVSHDSNQLHVVASPANFIEGRAMLLLRPLLRPFGYLAFVIALAAFSATAWLLGEEHELGFFASRLSRTVWRYPEVTRRGVQLAWLVWAVLFLVAASDDTPWDERALGALAVIALWRHFAARRRATR
jgi:hypothetical protein